MQVSIAQQLFVLALNDEGGMSKEAKAAVVAAGLYELENDGLVSIENDKVRVKAELPEDKKYLAPLYLFIEQREEVAVETVMDAFVAGDEAKAFVAALAEPLRAAGYLEAGKDDALVATAAAKRAFKDQAEDALKGAAMTRDEAAVMVFALGAGLEDQLFGREERRDLRKQIVEGKADIDAAAQDTFTSVDHAIEKSFAPMVRNYVAAH